MRFPAKTLPFAAGLALVACSTQGDHDPAGLRTQNGTEIVFLAQTVQPAAVMDALFEGRVLADAAGCLRLDSPDDATVVWPKGYTLRAESGEVSVRDPQGRAVGRLGGAFRLGGGEVPFLHEGIALSASDRQRAQAQCPGRFWIVGDVL